jgi:hypothetical protein
MVLIEIWTAPSGNDSIAVPGFEDPILHSAIVSQHRDERFRSDSRFRSGIGNFRSETLNFVGVASCAVVNDQIVARFKQVARQSRSHTPETDKSDFHDVTLLVGLPKIKLPNRRAESPLRD